jgi:phosphoribosylformimino-5-aminoimidazole carboxamide ribotide isomerase
MLIIPAIDVLGGRVVRLARGDYEKSTVYASSPLDYAKKWASEGATLIHVVDLDGAKSGTPVNFEIISQVASGTSVKVEVGGGIRSVSTVRKYLGEGIDRVVLSTKIIEDESFLLTQEIREYLPRIAVSLDIRRMEMAGLASSGTGGWIQSEDVLIDIRTLIRTVTSSGVRYLNFSDISKDGMLAGVDTTKILGFLKLARSAAAGKSFFTYAGGVSTLDDIKALKSLGDEAPDAAIVGRALYENKFTLKDAIEAGN